MSVQAMTAVFNCRRGDVQSLTRLVLMCLANRADEDNKCWPSQKLIAAECSISERAVQVRRQRNYQPRYTTPRACQGLKGHLHATSGNPEISTRALFRY